jgi:hypothetical protein
MADRIVNFKTYETLALFKQKLEDGTIKDTSIVFIKDKKLIWARGDYYAEVPDTYTKLEIDEFISDAKEVSISNGVEPTGDEKVWIDLSTSSEAETLTKSDVERVLTGNITSHNHDSMYLKDAPTTGGQYVRQSGKWAEVDIPDVDLTNYATKIYVDESISQQVSSVYRVRGSVADYSSLPTSDVKVGDVYTILDNGAEYVATEVGDTVTWEYLGEKISIPDASSAEKGLMTAQQVQDLEKTKSDITSINKNIEDNERVTSEALVNLDSRVNEINNMLNGVDASLTALEELVK